MGFVTKLLMILAIIAIIIFDFIWFTGSGDTVDQCMLKWTGKYSKPYEEAVSMCDTEMKMNSYRWHVLGASILLIAICALVFHFKE